MTREVCEQPLTDVSPTDVDASSGVEDSVQTVLAPFDSLYSATIERA